MRVVYLLLLITFAKGDIANQENDQLKNAIQRLQEETTHMEKKIDEKIVTSVNDMKNAHDSLSEQISRLQGLLNEQGGQIDGCTAAGARMEAALSAMDSKLQRLDGRVGETADSALSLHKKMKIVNKKIKAISKEVNDQTARIDRLKGEIREDLRRELTSSLDRAVDSVSSFLGFLVECNTYVYYDLAKRAGFATEDIDGGLEVMKQAYRGASEQVNAVLDQVPEWTEKLVEGFGVFAEWFLDASMKAKALAVQYGGSFMESAAHGGSLLAAKMSDLFAVAREFTARATGFAQEQFHQCTEKLQNITRKDVDDLLQTVQGEMQGRWSQLKENDTLKGITVLMVDKIHELLPDTPKATIESVADTVMVVILASLALIALFYVLKLFLKVVCFVCCCRRKAAAPQTAAKPAKEELGEKKVVAKEVKNGPKNAVSNKRDPTKKPSPKSKKKKEHKGKRKHRQ